MHGLRCHASELRKQCRALGESVDLDIQADASASTKKGGIAHTRASQILALCLLLTCAGTSLGVSGGSTHSMCSHASGLSLQQGSQVKAWRLRNTPMLVPAHTRGVLAHTQLRSFGHTATEANDVSMRLHPDEHLR